MVGSITRERGIALKKLLLQIMIFVVTLFLSIPGAWLNLEAAGKPAGKKTPAVPSRAISLRVLQKMLKSAGSRSRFSKELLQLAGMTKLIGYVIDTEKRDIILVGRAIPGQPPLQLDHFVVALRSSWRKYGGQEPGCSLDPTRRFLQDYYNFIKNENNLLKRIGGGYSSYNKKVRQKWDEKWRLMCEGPRKNRSMRVRVDGVPRTSDFSFVMLKADRDMKKLVDGQDTLNIQGFSSLMEIRDKKGVQINSNKFNRFWFHSGENLYETDQEVVLIKRCQVKLLTEAEILDRKGKLIGKGYSDPLAKEFAQSFTDHYAEVSVKRPIYAELENLFRFVALAKIIKMKAALPETSYLLKSYPVRLRDEKRFPSALPGTYNVQMGFRTCGGVDMGVKISAKNFVKDSTGRISRVRRMILEARPEPDALFWNIFL